MLPFSGQGFRTNSLPFESAKNYAYASTRGTTLLTERKDSYIVHTWSPFGVGWTGPPCPPFPGAVSTFLHITSTATSYFVGSPALLAGFLCRSTVAPHPQLNCSLASWSLPASTFSPALPLPSWPFSRLAPRPTGSPCIRTRRPACTQNDGLYAGQFNSHPNPK